MVPMLQEGRGGNAQPICEARGSQHCKKLPQTVFTELEDALPSLSKGSEGLGGS